MTHPFMEINKPKHLLSLLIGAVLSLLTSCSNLVSSDVDYSFEVAKDVKNGIQDFDKIDFITSDNNLDLGFYEGDVSIKLDISNSNQPSSYIVLCNDLINRNYRFYKLNKVNNTLLPLKETDLTKFDHRSFNYAKPNFQINLAPNETSTFFITTSSDGRILQATPSLISLNEFQSIRQQSLIFDIIFYVFMAALLLINLIFFRMVRSSIYYFYGAYILTGCLMYLFVEGRLYGLGISNDTIDHLMFVSIRLWILSGILFALNFLETKITNPKFYKFIIAMLAITLGLSTFYQLAFPGFSISTLHKAENIIGFMWIILSLTIIGIAYKNRKRESIYYLISYALFLVFVTLGLVDSHMTILPGDPFSYFKIGTIFEFIGLTYFISLLLKKKINQGEDLQIELRKKSQELVATSKKLEELNSLLASKSTIEKTDLINIFTLLENSLTDENDWEFFKQKFKELNPNYLNNLLEKHPDLTKSEIRLLTLIRIGYTQKEIADILNIAPSSVKKSRSRVRKKLDLSESTHLSYYLENF